MPNSTRKSRMKRGGVPPIEDYVLGLAAAETSSSYSPDTVVAETIKEASSGTEDASMSDLELHPAPEISGGVKMQLKTHEVQSDEDSSSSPANLHCVVAKERLVMVSIDSMDDSDAIEHAILVHASLGPVETSSPANISTMGSVSVAAMEFAAVDTIPQVEIANKGSGFIQAVMYPVAPSGSCFSGD